MFNPVIIIALIVQAIVRNISSMVGAIFGYILTTGILLWGISVYKEGNQIALFGVPLSQPVFISAIIFWYMFDTKELIDARKQLTDTNNAPIKEMFPKEIECPNCREYLELEENEINSKQFTCPECNNLIDMNIFDRNDAKRAITEEKYECAECHADVKEEDKICPKCGANLEEEEEYECAECHADVKEEDKICPKCGTNLEE